MKAHNYPSYGGRGIQVCARWFSFGNFYADMGQRPKGTSIDRIDHNSHYMPSNCRWATPKEQANNRNKPSVMVVRVGGISVALHRKLEQVALARGLSIADLIREGINLVLRQP